jgi:hypothetical protein
LQWKNGVVHIARKYKKESGINDLNWDIFKVLHLVLEPFNDFTKAVSEQAMTVGFMAVLVKMLSPHILKIVNLEIPDPAPDIALLKTAGEYMKEKLTKYEEVYESYEVYLSGLLDPRLKHEGMKKDVFEAKADAFFASFSEDMELEERDKLEVPQQPIEGLVGALQERLSGSRPQKKGELHRYLETDVALTVDPLQWWKTHCSEFPILARYARRHLVIQPTSVECERLFSIAGHVVSKRRTRLDPETVRYLLCLRSWSGLIPFNTSKVVAAPSDDDEQRESESDILWETDDEHDYDENF